jgi:hypothetical protein
MEEALRRLIRKIIFPKYKDISLEVIVHKTEDEVKERYTISFEIKNPSNIDEDVIKSLIDDTIGLITAIGFYNTHYIDYTKRGRIHIFGYY